MRFFLFTIIQNVINLIRFAEWVEHQDMSSGPSVKCPRCSLALYQVVAVSRGLNALSGDSPKIQSDVQGYFMTCPHCGERINFTRDPSAPSGIGYQLERRCGES
jgi:DNA-directed RNA polymerase subunit RPC12/RpoP